MSNNSTVIDSDFTNVTNVETISYGNNTITLTLGAESAEAGIVTVTDGTGVGTITIGAGHTNATTIALSSGTDVITATNMTAALTVTADIDNIDGDTITGGAGSMTPQDLS